MKKINSQFIFNCGSEGNVILSDLKLLCLFVF